MRSPKKNLAFKSRETASSDRSSCDLAAWGARSCSCVSQRHKLLSLAAGGSCGQPLLPSLGADPSPSPCSPRRAGHMQIHFATLRSTSQNSQQKLQPCADWQWGNPCLLLTHWLQTQARKMCKRFLINSVVLRILCMWVRLTLYLNHTMSSQLVDYFFLLIENILTKGYNDH